MTGVDRVNMRVIKKLEILRSLGKIRADSALTVLGCLASGQTVEKLSNAGKNSGEDN
jgi:hypothetical protein